MVDDIAGLLFYIYFAQSMRHMTDVDSVQRHTRIHTCVRSAKSTAHSSTKSKRLTKSGTNNKAAAESSILLHMMMVVVMLISSVHTHTCLTGYIYTDSRMATGVHLFQIDA